MKKIAEFFGKTSFYLKVALTAVFLFAEKTVEAFFWLFAWFAFFICLWLSGWSPPFLVYVFWTGAGLLYFYGLGRFALPARHDILRRLESGSGLSHRPLTALHDMRATSGDPELWRLEKTRQKKLLAKLRLSRPDLKWSRHDPYALRIAFLLLIFCACFIIPSDAVPRVVNGMGFSNTESGAAETPYAEVKITPPAYSGVKPFLLSGASRPVEILAGSLIEVNVNNAWGQPKLRMGGRRIALTRKDPSVPWSVQDKVLPSKGIAVTDYGIRRFSRKVRYRLDHPPAVAWDGDAQVLPTGEFRLPLKINDDYGIAKLTLRAILAPDEEIPLFGSPLLIEKKINMALRGDAGIKPVFDATGHVWAGKHVSMMVEAEDFAGNVADTTPLDMTLPVRRFRNPVAARLADIRENLLNLRGTLSNITEDIESVLYRPDLYRWDATSTLALRSADSRLHYDHSKPALESSAALLWSVALRLEEGKMRETQEDLRSALAKLQDALQKGADKTELAALMQQVREAMLRHLRNLARAMQNNGQLRQPPPGQSLGIDGLAAFLQKLQEDMAKGDTASAMDKINKLQQLTDMLGSSAAQGLPKDAQEMMQNLEDLQKLIARQKNNLDKTRAGAPADAAALSQEQKAINKSAADISAHVTENRQPLEDAQAEMAQASKNLENGNLSDAAAHQQKAIDLLNDAAKSLQQTLQKRMQSMTGISLGEDGPQDPLGRGQKTLRDDGTTIPQGTARNKADKIIKTLRDRESDMTRPLEERNYYQRLLKEW